MSIKTAKLRGLRNAKVLSVTQLSRRLGEFDTILMLGNNFGLFGSPSRARWLLRRFKSFTRPGARIIAETLDVYQSVADFAGSDELDDDMVEGSRIGAIG
ncbi:MAG: hypothetical protein R3305_03435, partial [Gammaproteobacteria bacterium]|nr:hypothetical protein [Gammaproteobacteria bacterium]